MREFTPEELKEMDGKDGKPVYVAFQGKVYDVTQSRLWAKGLHMNRHLPGRDLSGEIAAAPHGPEVLERYPQIGILKKGPPEELSHLPAALQTILQRFPMARRHPHPMVVHFPIAFLMASSLFYLLYLFLLYPSLKTTSTHLFALGTLATPFAIATGLLTWWVNYRLKMTPFIRWKIILSAFLLATELAVVLFWVGEIQVSHAVYLVLILLVTPLVVLLGYFGGQMTFPSEQ
ncbi:MAG: cytochrome b5 [Desulfobacterota bacterium]|nr:cytochrome b5 [Thermodesulfobacteriota bacterium]